MATVPPTAAKTSRKPKSKPPVPSLGPVRFEGLVEHLRQQITSGALLPGERLPSFVELQEQFGTSPGTVNRALISLEQDGMVVRERRRGVFVAKRRARTTQHTIGMAGLDSKSIHSSYWVQLIEGVQSVAHREEMELLLLRPNSTRGLDRIDAVVVHGDNEASLANMPHLMPTVSVIEKMAGYSTVAADDFDGSRQATEHLLQLGHRKIAFLHYLRAPINIVRQKGYRHALKEAGIVPQKNWIQDMVAPMAANMGPTMRDIGHARMKLWLDSGWKETGCTAVLCQNDSFAVGVMHAFLEAGLNVPGDVSVVGFDGLEEGQFCTPNLTTLEVPLRRIGERAAEVVLKMIDSGDQSETTELLPIKLIVRDSTAPPPH